MIDPSGDPATNAWVRRKVQPYYDTPAAPASLRASAAFTIAQTYFVEQRTDQACSWNNLALRLAPTNATYQTFAHERCP